MQIIRTILWVVATALLVAFIAMNWSDPVAVRFWPLADGNYLNFQWPVGIVALFFYLLGLVPMWLLAKAGRWRLNRRIASLENSVKAASAGTPAPIATSTQLDAAGEEAPSAQA